MKKGAQVDHLENTNKPGPGRFFSARFRPLASLEPCPLKLRKVF